MTQTVLFSIQSKSEEKVHTINFLLAAALISIIYVSQPLDTLASRDVAIDASGGGSASASADGRTISTGDSCTATFTSKNGTAAAAAAAKSTPDCLITSIPAQRDTGVFMNFLKSLEGKISPLAYQMTVPLGQSSFASNALRPLVDVSPFSVIGGHILLSSPSPHVKLIAASLANNSIRNATIIDLTEIKEQPQSTNAISAAGLSLYQANLGNTITGTNPFKGTLDTVDNITTLLLWNEATSPIQFSDDSQIAMTIIYSGSSAAAAFASASEDGKSIPSASRAAAFANGIGVAVP
ncbi:MAG: hypothetical protein WBL67_07085 [Nitrososphaeraceae archaeon]